MYLEINITLPSLCPTKRLMDHYPWVWKTVSFPFIIWYNNYQKTISHITKLLQVSKVGFSWNKNDQQKPSQKTQVLAFGASTKQKSPHTVMGRKICRLAIFDTGKFYSENFKDLFEQAAPKGHSSSVRMRITHNASDYWNEKFRSKLCLQPLVL